MDERVWDHNGGPRRDRRARASIALRTVAIAVLILAIVLVATWVSRGPSRPTAAPPASHGPAPSTSVLPAGEPVAFWTYPTRRGIEVGTVDDSGHTRKCHEFPGTEVKEWFASTLYLQNDVGIFGIDLDCSTSSVITYAALPGHKLLPSPQDKSRRPPLECVAVSPNGSAMLINAYGKDQSTVTSWTGSIDGTGWHLIGIRPGYQDPCRWIDETHFLAAAVAPFAIDTRTGKTAAVTDPGSASDGDTSAKGNRVVVARLDAHNHASDVEERWEILDTAQHTVSPLDASLAPVAFDRPHQTAWNPSGTMFLAAAQHVSDIGNGMKYQAVFADGKPVAQPFGVGGFNPLSGWFDDSSVYFINSYLDNQWIDVIDVQSGTTRFSFSPSKTQPAQIFVPGGRMGTPPDPVIADGHIVRHDERLGLSFLLPPGLSVDPCVRCKVGPYSFTRFIPFPAHLGTETCGAFGLLSFGTTKDSPATVRARLNSYYHLGERGYTDPSNGNYVSSQTSTRRIGSVSFNVLDYGFYECGESVAVGHVGSVTYIIDLTADQNDPTIALILGSIRFRT